MDGIYIEDQIFTLDKGVRFIPAKRCLISSGGKVITLSENSYRFLFLLLKGETDKKNLIDQVWFEQRGSVSESSYYGQLYLLRKAFNLAGLPNSLIRTLPKKGVKYVGYVASASYSEIVTPFIEEENSVVVIEDKSTSASNTSTSSTEILVSNDEPRKRTAEVSSWSKNRSWNIFISSMAVMAVCWLTTLVFMIFLVLER